MKDNSFIIEFLENRKMLNIEEEMNIYHLVTQTILLGISGEIVELGCNDGRTSAIIQKTLDENKSKKKIYVYDSFKGLPEKNKKDGNTNFKKEWCMKPKGELINVFKKYELKLPRIVLGWFNETLPKKLPKTICFAHLDGDFYSSIKESLESIYPKLSKGAIVVIDDFYSYRNHKKIEKLINKNRYSQESCRKIKIKNLLPGVKKACDEFFKDKEEKIKILIAGEERQAYFRKL